ncbi:Transposable element tcb2 transposase [Caligus rogercresseyi]|uniref:Transposable element tcb2 transposase n=1 Tax=Caligus rogercresseyi TaxID=217165 RepID=A0A7T8KBT8_CALRO|nr:Transposable element tcb2 transposase [Caligus rogercresseyi]
MAIRDAHVHPHQEAWCPPVVVSWMDSVAAGTPYTFQQDSAPRPQDQTCVVLAEEECAQLLGLQHLAPRQPRPEPMRLLLVREVGEGGVRHTP